MDSLLLGMRQEIATAQFLKRLNMVTKYAVYNAMTGESKLVDTKEEATKAFWENVINFALNQFHNNMYTIVEIDDNGYETWKTENGQEIPAPYSDEQVNALFAPILEQIRNAGV